MPQTNQPPLSMPTRDEGIIAGDGKVAVVWWRFWFGLLRRSAATIPYLVGTSLVAAGTTQATALALSAEWNAISTVAAGSGVILGQFGAGLDTRVWNGGANTLKVYPPLGCAIDGLGTNAPYALASGKCQVFSQLTATQYQSLQLG